MATVSESTAVKSLNKSPGRKRFTFKNFSQRIEEIDIDVFRNLELQKAEPSDGSSFLKDCLLEWRELNTAEDFISFYEEMMPWVQTLPQVLLHKETIMSKLLSRLRVDARLSLEPILRLIAALSRDLSKDFLPFLKRIADSLLHLLESGAEREPEVVEQIFTSWSYIMMYLQKNLTKDVIHVLKVTIHLRYYSKDYVQEFMAESVGFVLRNAPLEQLKKGIRKVTLEVVKKPSDVRKSGVSALLWYVMRGTSSRFNSKAEKVLRFLLDSSVIGIADKLNQGSETVAEVVTATFERLCEELPPEELNLMWSCLIDEISGCVGNESMLHLSRLLSILTSTVRFSNGGKISDYQPMLDLVRLLIQKVVVPLGSVKAENHYCQVYDRVLQLMLCLLDGLNYSDGSALSSISLQWAPVFELQNKSLVSFIKELLQKDPCLPYAFRHHIISAINDMVKSSPSSSEEVIYLMLTFFKKLGMGNQSSNCLDGESEEKVSRMCSFLRESICYWTGVINDVLHGDPSSIHLDMSKVSLIWGTITCYPHVLGAQENTPLIMDLVDALDQLLIINTDKIAGVSKHNWQSVVGAALSSYLKLQPSEKSGLAETSKFLHLAKKHKSSPQVLFAVAEFLDYTHGSTSEADCSHKIYHPEFEAEKAIDAINEFADNLCLPDKLIRISTLRILSHYEPLDPQSSTGHQPAAKRLKTEACQPCYENMDCSNVIQLLLSIEATPLSVSTSRKVIVLISRIQMALSAGKISESYVPLLLNGIIGVFHKRFAHLWEPAIQCLTVLIDKYAVLVWERLVRYLEQCQVKFLTSDNQLERVNVEPSSKSSDLIESFSSFVTPDPDGTPCTTVLSLLLQSLQKVHAIAESRSRQLVPLFFKFLGYDGDDIERVGLFKSHACKGKEWRGVLKEWLNLLKLMKDPKSLFRSQVLKEVLINRLLDENDADIQMKVLDCLVNFKFDFLVPYEQHLKNLITSKNLREELATWSLSKESHHIQEGHRGYLVPIVVRLLILKVRKLKTLAARKHASVHHRRAVLSFLGQLDVGELPLFFALLIKPLLPVSNDWFWRSCENSIEEFQACSVVKYLTVDEIGDISWKKRYGFLHVIEDIFKSFDEVHIKPFLNLLMGFVVRLLETCTLRLDSAKNNEASQAEHLNIDDPTVQKTSQENPIMTNTAIKQHKDLRSLCLKVISFLLNKYEDHDFGCEFWDMFFKSVKALIEGFKQEGSSSEKPSSLFSCFLAMSRSPTLVSLLHREESLVPSIFSVLTVKTASSAIISSVLSFAENLLNLDNDMDNGEDLAVKSILLPNLDILICSLHSLFQCHKEKQRKLVKWPGKAELRIFKLLSKYIVEPLAAQQFVDILLPFLGNKAKNSYECLEVLHVIKGVLSKLGSETTGKILIAVAPLLISAGADVRLCICDILNVLAINDPSVAFLAKLVRELNAISVSEIDELDYDTIINAYESITPEFFSTIGEDHALIILSHCIHDLASEELILRQSAHRLMLSFVQFSALILGCESKNCQETPEPRVALETDACWTKARCQRIIKKFIMKHMGEAMSKEISIQREWVALLREMVLRLSEIPSLKSIRDLCSEDAEVDFFNNILHLQKHRRARALARFRKAIGAGDFSEVITKKVFVPLFFKMLFDVQPGKGEHIRNACVESLAAISGHMRWESYHSFLLRCFREMILKPDKYKVLLRLICSVLDHFHFSGMCLSQEPKDNDSVSRPNIIELSSSSSLHGCTTSGDPTEIQVSLQKTVLPKIQKLLTADSEKVEVTISLAALKLLKLLPIDTMESQLPSIIHRICNFLKNRLESIRDEARLALAACSKELGLEYLQFLVKVMRTTLKRGYEMHVLGYTLNFILSKALSEPATGKLDYCLEELLSVAENDILGEVAEQKDVEKIASKMKETRKRKSFETLKLIAQSVTFKTHALKLLSPVKAHLQKHLTPRKKAKLETMLNHIAAGIECNPSVDQTDLFVFVYGLIEDGTAEEVPQGKDLSIVKPSKQFSNGTANKGDASRCCFDYESQSSHLITVFALGVLHNRLKNMKLDKKDESLLSMLDPFVKLLGNCLSSKYGDILSSALRCLAPLVRLPLPSLESHADKIKTLLLDIAQKSGTRDSPLMQSCLRLLTVLLRSTRIVLSNDQLHMLIQFPLFVDLERNPSFVALSLLKAIVSRTLVASEIYDIATRVGELMVTSQLEPIRKKCSQILLQFLLDYRLSDKRLQQHLDFLLANLSYEHSSGREAVLEMLHAIIIKFPQSIVDAQAETFFVRLVACLANDQDNKVRSMVGSAIKLLIGRTSQRSVLHNLENTLSWYLSENQNLWSVAAQVLGLLVEVLKKGFQSHINTVLPVVKRIMKSALDGVTNKQPDPSNEATIPFWKETYYSLVMLEKILYQFPELYLEKDLEEIWEAICELLLHPHMWIRNISNRLVASYFAATTQTKREKSEKLEVGTLLLMKPSRLFSIAVSLCCQLKAPLTDDAACKVLTQNLVFAISGVHLLVGQKKSMDLHEFWSTLELHEQSHFLKAFQMLGSRKGRILLGCLTSDGKDSIDQADAGNLQSLLVSPLLKKIGKVALQMDDIQMKIVFNCFSMISSQIGQEGCQKHAIDILLPLYKVCEGFAGKLIADDVKQLGEEVRDRIQQIMGVENFVQVYNQIRKNLKEKRDKRRNIAKVMAVVNPMRNAKRKLRVAAKHRANKKRKLMTMKMGRWVH